MAKLRKPDQARELLRNPKARDVSKKIPGTAMA
jgi:hypothetical protein